MKGLSSILCVLALISWNNSHLLGQRRGLNVRDDIDLVTFGDLYGEGASPVLVSPDDEFVVIQSEYGSLDDDRLHDELRVYDMSQLGDYVDGAGDRAPLPIWTIHEATYKDGGESTLVQHIRWLSDSSGFAYLLKNSSGHMELRIAELSSRSVVALTPSEQDVTAYDIRSPDHYAFTVTSEAGDVHRDSDAEAETVLGASDTLYDAVFSPQMMPVDRSELWAAVGGKASPIFDTATGRVVAVYPEGRDNLTLSPDGRTLLIALPVPEIPRAWETRYLPPYREFPTPIVSGEQNLLSNRGYSFVSEYAAIDLKRGIVTLLTDGPTALRAGWWANFAPPAWSSDGQWIILPGAFVPNGSNDDTPPCVAVRELSAKGSLQCVVPLKRNLSHGFEPEYKRILSVKFEPGRNDRIDISYLAFEGTAARDGFMTYQKDATGNWRVESDAPIPHSASSLRIEVKMGFDEPPTLVGEDTKTGITKVIWDPNPQLRDIALGKVSPYRWNDETGRAWSALLYTPINYVVGKRYPLVIQNHGFDERRFSPSGGFPSAFVAQELAGAGIMVLQMRDCAGRGTPQELPCNVMGYESAVAQLSHSGLVDPQNVGIIGFSRTVSYVLAALSTSTLHFKAASVYDGINLGYFQQVANMGATAWEDQISSMIGALPYGPGLYDWIARSPEFNLDKVTTPTRIVARGALGSIAMWEPYALLREMGRPVEFLQLQTNEHVITDPAIRLAAQGGNVDWFRYWLQGYEDPDPTKAEEYRRWRDIRKASANRTPSQ
ncbi:hypothetical protein ACFPT7_07750 [Acidicapsa dinghuensis]|uniref:Peptidase S9 prolyl oligopeptidase catalytic domain-containing protein n=1 Tax=Acidicapsa dinghuensis TaxID=2218256 RepID=A0ABW1EFZ1_9BACT|nr:hypothetical protein [Acidicapsa dinghuensis]